MSFATELGAGSFLNAEFSALREEMRELKRCQLQYFTLAVVAAGAILGTNGLFGLPADRSVAVLAPLLVILPCWLTFFDKATTVTRIAAYVRLIEEDLSAGLTSLPGFEIALRRFRKFEDQHGPLGRVAFKQIFSWQYLKLSGLGTRHRYWALNWWTFLSLAATCNLLPFWLGVGFNPFKDSRAWWPYGCALVVGAVLLFTLWVLINLNVGCYSYNKNEERWRQVLGKAA